LRNFTIEKNLDKIVNLEDNSSPKRLSPEVIKI